MGSPCPCPMMAAGKVGCAHGKEFGEEEIVRHREGKGTPTTGDNVLFEATRGHFMGRKQLAQLATISVL